MKRDLIELVSQSTLGKRSAHALNAFSKGLGEL
jgi:hypothetical protein